MDELYDCVKVKDTLKELRPEKPRRKTTIKVRALQVLDFSVQNCVLGLHELLWLMMNMLRP